MPAKENAAVVADSANTKEAVHELENKEKQKQTSAQLNLQVEECESDDDMADVRFEYSLGDDWELFAE